MTAGITYHNKDVLFKILSEHYKSKSLSVYGLNMAPIKQVLPNTLPSIQLDEKRSDNIFLLEDGTILLLEYESTNDDKNLLKYCHYVFRVSETYCENPIRKLAVAVIYTGNVKQASASIDLGCIKLNIEQVFLSNFDGNIIYSDLKTKIENNQKLTDEDIMRFIILPLTERNNSQTLLEKTVNLAKKITDEDKQSFIVAGILSATDKFIDKDYSNNLKEWLRMTKVGRLFEEEKLESVHEAKKEIARKMLSENVDTLTVMKFTSLSKAEILELQKEFSA